MNAHFCEKTGARIAAPGVSKAVDPVNGQDEVDAPATPAAEGGDGELAELRAQLAAADARVTESDRDVATLTDYLTKARADLSAANAKNAELAVELAKTKADLDALLAAPTAPAAEAPKSDEQAAPPAKTGKKS